MTDTVATLINESSTSESGVVLDGAFFPHIVEKIVAETSGSALIAFRGSVKGYDEAVHRQFHHVQIVNVPGCRGHMIQSPRPPFGSIALPWFRNSNNEDNELDEDHDAQAGESSVGYDDRRRDASRMEGNEQEAALVVVDEPREKETAGEDRPCRSQWKRPDGGHYRTDHGVSDG